MCETQLCANDGLTHTAHSPFVTLSNFVTQICFPRINFEVVAFPDTYRGKNVLKPNY